MTTTGHDDPHENHTHMAMLIERSSLGTREGRLRRSTVSAGTGRAIARSAIARSAKSGRYVSAATAARHPRTTVTDRGRRSGRETPHNPKGSTPSDDL
jgi:hypothetical protein